MIIKQIVAILCVFLTMTASGCGSIPQLLGMTQQTPATAPSPTTSGGSTAVASTTPPPSTTTPVADDPNPPDDPSLDVVPTLMSPPSGPERIEGIAQGAPAPFEGVILNADAAGWLVAEPDAVQQRCQLFVTRRLGELRARLLSDTQRLQLRVDTLTQIQVIELRARDQQIQLLTQTNADLRNGGGQWWEQILIGLGVFVVGAALGMLVGFILR